jgi:ATP-binding protein involved in chromosome partitioning
MTREHSPGDGDLDRTPIGRDVSIDEVAFEEGRSSAFDAVSDVIAVASAKGGVGKSTVAVSLACAFSDEERVGLFDADLHGPNVPRLLDVEGPVYADESDNPMPVDLDGLEVMSVGLLKDGGPLAWRGAMAHEALSDLFETTAWNDRDTLVIDLPPGTGDLVLTTLQEFPIDGVVFVTTPFPTAVADTARSIALFEEEGVPVLGVISNMGSFTCPTCGDEHDLFQGDDPVDDFDVPVLAELPFNPAAQGEIRPGDVPDPFASMADAVDERLSTLLELSVPEDAVDLRDVPPNRRHEAVEDAFTGLSSGAEFVLASDRDPSPVRSFLADLADADESEEAFEQFEVERATPEAWVLRTRRP